jgi:cytochrome c-type biogenesis protein CcmH/NrfF
MKRRAVFLLPMAAACLLADPANGDPRLEKLFARFIAPCCWQGNLLVHNSPQADELRADIRRRVAEGETDEQIKAAYLEKYSMRILAVPDGSRGQWLTWTPVAFGVAGAGFLGWLLRRMVKAPAPVGAVVGELPDFDWEEDVK